MADAVRVGDGVEIRYDDRDERYDLAFEVPSYDKDGLSEALDRLLAATVDLDRVRTQVRPLQRFDNDFFALVPEGPGRSTEADFFRAAIAHEELQPKVAAWVERLVTWCRGTGPHPRHRWHDELHPVGCWAAAPLALAARRWVPLLRQHLEVSDLDHETFHERLLDRVIARHGWSEETLELIAFRAGAGHGQRGAESLFRAQRDHDLRGHLDRTGGHDAFLALLDRHRLPEHDWAEAFVMPGAAMYHDDHDGYRAWVARLAAHLGTAPADYPTEPERMTAGPPYEGSDWDDPE